MIVYRIIRYLVATAARGIRGSYVLHVVAVATLSCTFLILGGSYLIFSNLRDVLVSNQGRLQISVYVKDRSPKKALRVIQNDHCKREFVRECLYRSTEDARAHFLRMNPDLKNAVESLKQNPFPASYEIYIQPDYREGKTLAEFSNSLKALPGVEAVDDGGDWTSQWLTFLKLASWTKWTVGIALALATIFVVANTIKLVVYARRDEVEILNLVGATNAMVRIPFLLEGIFQGLLAAIIAILVLRGFYFSVDHYILGQWGAVLPAPLRFLTGQEQFGLLVLGMALGMMGSGFAVGRHLR